MRSVSPIHRTRVATPMRAARARSALSASSVAAALRRKASASTASGMPRRASRHRSAPPPRSRSPGKTMSGASTGRSNDARVARLSSCVGTAIGRTGGGMRATPRTPASSSRVSVARESATVRSANSTLLGSSPARGALATVWTTGFHLTREMARATDEVRGLGWKKKCQAASRPPRASRARTRAPSAADSPWPPDARTTRSTRAPSGTNVDPREPSTTGVCRRSAATRSRTIVLLPSFQGGSTGFDTNRISAMARTGSPSGN